jgi:broad specificity phosphatase PhoE
VSILLMRHAETALNAARVVQPPDTPLNARGVAQADRLGRRLAELQVTRILSSDQARARMTADRVQAATGAPIEIDPGLQERNFGDIRGTPYAELTVDIFAPDYEPPGGEIWQDFHLRVDAVWDRVIALAARVPGNLAVVTHGLVCRSLATRKLELPKAIGVDPEHWGNTALTIIEGAPPWRVQLLNCVAHLDFEVADDAGSVSGI